MAPRIGVLSQTNFPSEPPSKEQENNVEKGIIPFIKMVQSLEP